MLAKGEELVGGCGGIWQRVAWSPVHHKRGAICLLPAHTVDSINENTAIAVIYVINDIQQVAGQHDAWAPSNPFRKKYNILGPRIILGQLPGAGCSINPASTAAAIGVPPLVGYHSSTNTYSSSTLPTHPHAHPHTRPHACPSISDAAGYDLS